jgi:peptide/nickel transport system permease protein
MKRRWRARLRSLILTPGGLCAAAVVCWLVAAALAPRSLAPFDPLMIPASGTLLPPSAAHPAGTDALGRDIFSQIVYGARTTLWVAASAMVLALAAGTTLGLVAGYWGGSAIDELVMRLVDVLYVFPSIVLALAVVAALGPDRPGSVALALALAVVPGYARLVRSRVLTIREDEFIVAARSIGATTVRILRRHILPQTIDVLIVRSVVGLSGIILAEATLSFLGLGVQPPNPSWGRMLRESFQYLSDAPWLALAPMTAIFLTVFAISQLGEAVRIGLHPHADVRR